MPSWKCGLCTCEKRWPTKQQALDHIEERHFEALVRSSLRRSGDSPTEKLPHEE